MSIVRLCLSASLPGKSGTAIPLKTARITPVVCAIRLLLVPLYSLSRVSCLPPLVSVGYCPSMRHFHESTLLRYLLPSASLQRSSHSFETSPLGLLPPPLAHECSLTSLCSLLTLKPLLFGQLLEALILNCLLYFQLDFIPPLTPFSSC